MQTMAKLRRGIQASALAAFGLVLSQSCVRSEPLHPADDRALVSKQELPFHPEESVSTNDAGFGLPSDAKLKMPFRPSVHPRVIPPGTLLTVQLMGSLSASRVHAGDGFVATVAAPLTVDGETLIPRGATVTGLVESAQSQPERPGSGYFRLTLRAITVEGRPTVVQTSSLFARASVQPSPVFSDARTSNLPSAGIRVQKGHPLTFRLIAPVSLDDVKSTLSNPAAAVPSNSVLLH
jgi:hypothetical protein